MYVWKVVFFTRFGKCVQQDHASDFMKLQQTIWTVCQTNTAISGYRVYAWCEPLQRHLQVERGYASAVRAGSLDWALIPAVVAAVAEAQVADLQVRHAEEARKDARGWALQVATGRYW